MKIMKAILLLILIIFISGCYPSLTGTVVDAETGRPIEGAVVLAEWTKTKGFGLTHTESYKVVEVLTDKEGKFKVSGVIEPFINPHLTVYKKGYIAWNNEIIFPGYKKRTDFKWSKAYAFKLEYFKPEYSYDKHVDFIESSIGSSQKLEAKKTIFNAFAWERQIAMQERIKKGLSP